LAAKRLVFRVHAIRRMFQRSISEEDVRHVLDTGEVIEDYPQDQPYPSRLMLGWQGTWPIHIVVADNTQNDEIVVITVYEPDLVRWEPGFQRRRTP
jgi:hypothetical protein